MPSAWYTPRFAKLLIIQTQSLYFEYADCNISYERQNYYHIFMTLELVLPFVLWSIVLYCIYITKSYNALNMDCRFYSKIESKMVSYISSILRYYTKISTKKPILVLALRGFKVRIWCYEKHQNNYHTFWWDRIPFLIILYNIS